MTVLTRLIAEGNIAADWEPVLRPVAREIEHLEALLAAEEASGVMVLPAAEYRYAAFAQPFSQVRVVIVGQDPYPTPGHAIGVAFSTAANVSPLPRSLQNVFRELSDDLGVLPPAHGDLRGWSAQGVLLLNRVLSVRAGEAGSHRRLGWERVTECALRALAARGGSLVAVLWGNDARALSPLFDGVPVVESAHPSPLSASRGFFGSRPFSRVNELLAQQLSPPIQWRPGAE